MMSYADTPPPPALRPHGAEYSGAVLRPMPRAPAPQRRLRVLLDVDGVLADFVGGVTRELRLAGYRDLTPDAFDRREIAVNLLPDEKTYFDSLSRRPGFCRSLEWYPGAEAFARALAFVHDVTIVTAPWRSSSWDSERRAWLLDGADIPSSQVISCPRERKRMVGGDVLIEDCAETLVDWLAEHPKGSGVLVKRPWNQVPAGARWLHIAHSYKELAGIIGAISGGAS